MINVFQYISLLFTFNIFSSHRKKIYLNKLFMLYFPLLLLYSSCLITVKEFKDYFFGNQVVDFKDDDEVEEVSERAKMITLLFSAITSVLTYIYESMISIIA